MPYIILICVGLVLVALSFLIGRKTDDPPMQNAVATIDNVIFSDTGNVKFYVSFYENGELKTGQSVYYSDTQGRYHEGDSVNIRYYLTKGGFYRVQIQDPDLVLCSESSPAFKKVLLFIGIGLSVLGAVLMIKSFF